MNMKLIVVLLLCQVIAGASEEDQDSAFYPDPFEDYEDQDYFVDDASPDDEPETLPSPEAYHGLRRRPRPALVYVRRGEAPLSSIGEHDRPKPPYMNDLYTSSLNDIQQDRQPVQSSQDHSIGGVPYAERDPMDTDESWTLWSSLVPGTRSHRPTIRPRNQPYPRVQGRVRNRGRPGKNGGRIRFFPMGRQNGRRPAVINKRPRAPFSQTAVRPRFRGPAAPYRPPPAAPHRPPPSIFPVTEPTTSAPDTLSVHNIAGPPYADTIPPNILFRDDEITTPFEYTSPSILATVTPPPSSFQSWVPVSASGTRWTYRSTTPAPVTKSIASHGELDDASNREKEVDTTKWGNTNDDKWGEDETGGDDYIWGSDLNFRWPNSWNHNWGADWGMKFSTDTTAKPRPTPTSGYATPSGRTNWEGEEYFATSAKGPEGQRPEITRSYEDSYMEDNLPNHKFSSETTTSLRFPDFPTENQRHYDSTENQRHYDSPSTKNFMFSEDLPTDKPRISDSVGNIVNYPEAGSSNKRYDTMEVQDIHEYHPVRPSHPKPLPGNQRFSNLYGASRRVITVPKEPSPTLQGYPVRIKTQNNPQYSQGLRTYGKGTLANNRFSESRISVKATRPNQPVLRPVYSPTLPPRIWTPGRVRASSMRHRPRG
ncbi:uncharacterized protein [Palaemon carinicauda]|uniref:uncharacterized protein n=1 Tax=Palaemon carinicauda TaxID=392227 RepID=UPI0035B63165